MSAESDTPSSCLHDAAGSHGNTLPLAVVALGVVFGDIGTSPLYAFKECLEHGASPSDVFGVLSLILWSLILLVSVKYVGLILRADNRGEGGILALLALAFPEKRESGKMGRTAFVMTGLGIFGAALLYGDGAITPAISVLSAVEGLELISPLFERLVVPLTLVILVALFSVQRYGTGAVGGVFGKIMILWFVSLGAMGLTHVVRHPEILAAFNPLMGARYLQAHSAASMVVLGSVFLSVTGGEALYADMGHFGRIPIRLAWNTFVLPALALNYLGQGVLVLADPAAAENPFFRLAPGWALWPLILLATLATIIASQALISGAFSLTTQAMQMGYLPRMQVMHTSRDTSGQIYIPRLNYALAAACIGLVIGFRSSSALASAYGIAVTLTMLATTSLFYFAARRVWGWTLLQTLPVCLLFGVIEAAFFASNALKVFHGGWLPLLIGIVLFFLMTTWKIGRGAIRKRFEMVLPLREFVTSINLSGVLSEQHSPHRVKGTAVFLSGSKGGTPNALLQNLKHNHVIHERNIILNIVSDQVPYCERDARLQITPLDGCFYQITAHFGFMEIPSIDEVVAAAAGCAFEINPDKTTFFLGRETLVPDRRKGWGKLRRAAFIVMSRNAQNAAEFFHLPSSRTIEIGLHIDI